MTGKLFLIDGHSLIFRMYYALLRHPMINSKGEDVSILYGFTKYILEIISKEKPTHLAVCFDPPGKTFRHQMYPQYKGTRQATPELVIEALDPLIELCGAMGIPVLMVPGFEGDDVLGSMAVRSADRGFEVYMVTPDKDFGQLISDRIFQFKPGKAGADNEIWGVKEICAKFGLSSPLQVIDILTLCGDAADNVPGVAGIGEVGASKLIGKYGSVENIYEHIDELTPRQKQQFLDAQDHIALSKTLVTIKTDIAFDVPDEAMAVRTLHDAKVMELFDRYEFPSLKNYIHLAEGQEIAAQTTRGVSLDFEAVSAKEFEARAHRKGKMSLLCNVDACSALESVVCATEDSDKYYVCECRASEIEGLLADASVVKSGNGLKSALHLLSSEGCQLAGRLDDIELMHYLIDPEKSHKVETLARHYLDLNLETEQPQCEPSAELGLFDSCNSEQPEPKSRAMESVAVLLLSKVLRDELASNDLIDLYDNMEEPLIRVLARMEETGVRVDMLALRSYADSLRKEISALEEKIRTATGEPTLNLSSPKQVGVVLYEKLRIDPRVKPKKDAKNPYLTDEETLASYADNFPIIYDILEYRGLKKLLGTYIEPFGDWVSPSDGRIHTTFNQALTATGRLSSSRPNLQNIPVRTERGKEIRKAFVPADEDDFIVSADYSQIELRLMAHFCADTHMVEAFCKNEDVHSLTASKIFRIPVAEVTSDMRRTAKTANFGIMYGISPFGLAQRLHVPRVAAKKIIEDYFNEFPSISAWIENTKSDASAKGYVQTLFGRRRYLPDINSRNATARALAERNAVNAPIQGTAADIIKMAMISVDGKIREKGLRSRMILQIHDELVFEAPKEELDELMKIIKNEMENVLTLSIPLTVECNYGKNWLEAH